MKTNILTSRAQTHNLMRALFLISFLLLSFIGFSQTSAGPDKIICISEITTLEGSGSPDDTFLWTSVPNDNTISDPTSLTPTVQPIETTVYTLEGRNVSPNNLVVNGEFEDGNTGFTSSYLYSPGANGLWDEGTYAITNNANFNHNNFSCSNDHTENGEYFMAVNGSAQANVVVWSTSINITQDTEYEFSTWVSSLSPTNPAILQFRINGELIGEPFHASAIICVWGKFFEIWNSGTATSAVISIVNQNTIGNGNDFSLDDINFSFVTYSNDDCTVTVDPLPTSSFDISTQTCSADTSLVTYTGDALVTDQYNWDFNGANVISGTGQGPYKIQWSSAGTYTVQLWVEGDCISETTSKDINVHFSPTSVLNADENEIPFGTTTFLHGIMSGNPGPVHFEWTPEDKLQNPDSQDPQTVILEQSTLFTFFVTDETNQCMAFDTVTIKVTGGPLSILSLTASPESICQGESTTLSLSIEGGSGNYTTTWTSDPPGFNYSGSETEIFVSPTVNTIYFAQVTDGFTTTSLISVQVIILSEIEVIDQPQDILVEEGETAIFTVAANNHISFQWQLSTDSGVNWTNINNDATYSGTLTNQLTVVNISTSFDSYLYRCHIEGECNPINSNDAELNVFFTPDFIGVLQDISICQTETFNIPCNIENFVNIDSLSFTFTFDIQQLQFDKLENIHPDLSSLLVSQTADSIKLSWTSSNSVSISDGSLFELVFKALGGGQTNVEWSSSCKVKTSYNQYPELFFSSSTINITALPETPLSAIANPDSLNILDEIDIELETIGGSGAEVVWTTGLCDGTIVGEGNPLNILRPEETTTYFAKWSNHCGLSECKEVQVKITEQFLFAVPNAFSPNGDGINDEFGIISISTLPYFEFNIFNKWGQLIFKTNNQNEKWDGNVNDEKAQAGTYVWRASYKFRSEGLKSELHQESGTITIIL